MAKTFEQNERGTTTMMYLHDVWVNWFEGEESGLNVCPFHEWRKTDPVELLDQVPVLKINPLLYEYVENSLSELPDNLLKDIHHQAYIRKNHERVHLENCAIFTDSKRIIVMDTIGYTIPIRKSRLVPRQEQQVIEMVANVKELNYNLGNKESSTFLDNMSKSKKQEEALVGLTRKERQLKQILLLALDQILLGENVLELRYWFTEWYPEKYHEAKNLSFNDAGEKFYNTIANGWSEKHERLCEKMIRGQKYLEQLWEVEMGERPFMK